MSTEFCVSGCTLKYYETEAGKITIDTALAALGASITGITITNSPSTKMFVEEKGVYKQQIQFEVQWNVTPTDGTLSSKTGGSGSIVADINKTTTETMGLISKNATGNTTLSWVVIPPSPATEPIPHAYPLTIRIKDTGQSGVAEAT